MELFGDIEDFVQVFLVAWERVIKSLLENLSLITWSALSKSLSILVVKNQYVPYSFCLAFNFSKKLSLGASAD